MKLEWIEGLLKDIEAVTEGQIKEYDADLPRRKKEVSLGKLSDELIKMMVSNGAKSSELENKMTSRMESCKGNLKECGAFHNECIALKTDIEARRHIFWESVRAHVGAEPNGSLAVVRGFEVIQKPAESPDMAIGGIMIRLIRDFDL